MDVAKGQMGNLREHLRKVLMAGDAPELTDGQLLECFVRCRDEAAVAVLVRRYGPMVWGVCRRALRNHHDAEDAFQATFLVLVRKAASIVPREKVANWLYGVAQQTARKARAATAKRQAREKQVKEMPEPEAVTGPDLGPDLQPLLDQELSRLPDKYRAAILLCDLQSKTRQEAARQLNIPEGTLSSRLTTARTMLARLLTRRGLAVAGGALAALLSRSAASAAVPASVMSSTIQALRLCAAGRAAPAGVISDQVAALTQGVLKAMLWSKFKIVQAAFLVVAAVLGVGGMIYYTPAAAPAPAPQGAGPNTPAEPKPRGGHAKEKFADFARLHNGGGVVSATGIRGKGGFTVVPMQAVAGRSKFAVSFTSKEEDQRDFRIVAVDAAGKRHQAIEAPGSSAGGDGIMIHTTVVEFNLSGDQIDTFVIQLRQRDTK